MRDKHFLLAAVTAIWWTMIFTTIAEDAHSLYEDAREKQLRREPAKAIEGFLKVIEKHRDELEYAAPALVNMVACFQLLCGAETSERQYRACAAKYLEEPPPLDGHSQVTLEQAREALLWKPWNHVTLKVNGELVSTVAAQLEKQLGLRIVCTPKQFADMQIEWNASAFNSLETIGISDAQRVEALESVKKSLKTIADFAIEEPRIDLELNAATCEEALNAFANAANYLRWRSFQLLEWQEVVVPKALLLRYFEVENCYTADQINSELEGAKLRSTTPALCALGRATAQVHSVSQQYSVYNGQKVRSVPFEIRVYLEPGMRLPYAEQGTCTHPAYAYDVEFVGEDGKTYRAEKTYNRALKKEVDPHYLVTLGRGFPGHLRLVYNGFPPELKKLKKLKGKLKMKQPVRWAHNEVALKPGAVMRNGAHNLTIRSFEKDQGEYKVTIKLNAGADEPPRSGAVAVAAAGGDESNSSCPFWLKGKGGRKIRTTGHSGSGGGNDMQYTMRFPASEEVVALGFTEVEAFSERDYDFEFTDVELP